MNTITATAEIAEAEEYIIITWTNPDPEYVDEERYFFPTSEYAPTESEVDEALAEGGPVILSTGRSFSWRRVGPISGRFFTVESIETDES